MFVRLYATIKKLVQCQDKFFYKFIFGVGLVGWGSGFGLGISTSEFGLFLEIKRAKDQTPFGPSPSLTTISKIQFLISIFFLQHGVTALLCGFLRLWTLI